MSFIISVLFDLQVASHMKCAAGMHTVIM